MSRLLQDDFRESALEMGRLLQMSLPQAQVYFRQVLSRHGTNVDQNDKDPLGDGDQSRVTRKHAQFYREMFACGGDINHHADQGLRQISIFAKHCISGNVKEMKRLLDQAAGSSNGPPSPALIQLLERRETSLRLSPLLMLVSIGKNLQMPGSSADDQIQAAKLLLEYGARPDARDVCGKTVCHYGMGAMATKMTMQVVELCHQAHTASSHLFGKQVELHNLSEQQTNGARGWCLGYNVDTGRRSVYLSDAQKMVSIKPQNLKLATPAVNNDASAASPSTATTSTSAKLCDIPDRLGIVCLLEVIQGDRTDVAKILLDEYNANLDIEDCDGISPRSLSLNTAIMSSAAAMVNEAAGARGKRQEKVSHRTCCNCGGVESSQKKLLTCAICSMVWYCSKTCQRQHWNAGGHKKVCKDMAASKTVAIMLQRPKDTGQHMSLFSLSGKARGTVTNTHGEGSGYRQPSHVGVGEKFDLKVQGTGGPSPLMLYDKTRECNFYVSPGEPGFTELLKAVQAEPTWQGRKTFVTASFDAGGNCIVYPALTSVKKW